MQIEAIPDKVDITEIRCSGWTFDVPTFDDVYKATEVLNPFKGNAVMQGIFKRLKAAYIALKAALPLARIL